MHAPRCSTNSLPRPHWNESRLPVVIARLFNTVGPRQTGRYGMVIPRFVEQARAGEPITVYGDGTQTRCFAHVADVVGALIALMNEPKAAGQVFNIGNDEEVSIMELAERVRSLTGGKSAIRLVPYGEAYTAGFEDMMRRVPDLVENSPLDRLSVHARTRPDPRRRCGPIN